MFPVNAAAQAHGLKWQIPQLQDNQTKVDPGSNQADPHKKLSLVWGHSLFSLHICFRFVFTFGINPPVKSCIWPRQLANAKPSLVDQNQSHNNHEQFFFAAQSSWKHISVLVSPTKVNAREQPEERQIVFTTSDHSLLKKKQKTHLLTQIFTILFCLLDTFIQCGEFLDTLGSELVNVHKLTVSLPLKL